jgi:hypothetical protein
MRPNRLRTRVQPQYLEIGEPQALTVVAEVAGQSRPVTVTETRYSR